MQEIIDIVIRDKIDASIAANLRTIGTNAAESDRHVAALSASLSKVSGTQLNAAASASSAAAQAIAKAAQAQAAAAAAVTNAQNSAAISSQNFFTAQMRTAEAAAKAAAANTNAATAAAKLSTEQNRTATAAAQAAAAKDRAAIAAQKLAASNAAAAQAALNAANAATAAATANAKQATSANNASAANNKNAMALKGSASASSLMAKAGAALGTVLGAGEIIKMADAYTTMQNKLQNVSTSQAQVNELTGRLFDLANDTRSSVESTTTAFTRFDRSLKQMGKSQDETFRMTETINKALIVSGATATEASSSLLQLSQAFNSGKLNGDEFRSVSENMPVVLDAVAKAMNIPINQVKKMASEGKISAEVLFKAFKLIEKQIDDTFAKTTPTVAQAMTVLKNSATQFFGELDKSLGITKGLSEALIFLSKNLDVLAVAAVAVGAAMLVAFGPAILGAIGAAALAVKAFTLALLANPIGLVIAAVATLATAFAVFGDKIKIGVDGITTLKDVAVASFQVIDSLFSDIDYAMNSFLGRLGGESSKAWGDYKDSGVGAMSGVTASVNASTSSWTDSYSEFFSSSKKGLGAFTDVVAKTIDATMGLVVGLVVFVGRSVTSVFEGTVNAIKSMYNSALGLIESFLNVGVAGINKLNGAMGISPMEGFKFDKASVAKSGQSFGEIWSSSMEDGFASQGAFQRLNNKILDRAQQIAKDRESASIGKGYLRGNGKNQFGDDPDGKAAKKAESRAKAMDLVNMKLDGEIRRLDMLAPLREREEKFDQIKEQLAQKNITLSKGEEAAIRSKIAAIQTGTKVQSEMDRMYQEAIGPMETYNNALAAADILFKNGAISREEYTKQMNKTREAYMNHLDPMREEMMALKDQQTLLTHLPRQREIEAKMMELQTRIRKGEITATNEQIAAYRQELLVLQQKNAVDAEKNSLMESSVYAREKFINQLNAIKELQADPTSGFTKGDAAQVANGMLGGMGIDTSTMQVDMDAKLAMYSTYYGQLDAMRAQQLISEQDYANARAQISMQEFRTKTAQAEQFFSGMAQLQGSNISALAKMGKAAAITQAIINTYEAATKALTAGPYLGPVMAAVVTAQGMSQVAAIRSQGYKKGGYTGAGPAGMEAGPAHKNEFIMNSPSTSRLGVGNLDALMHGRAQIVRNNANAGNSSSNAVAQGVAANAPKFVQQSGGDTNVRIINQLDPAMVGDFLATAEGEDVLINTIRRNGDIVKSVVNGN